MKKKNYFDMQWMELEYDREKSNLLYVHLQYNRPVPHWWDFVLVFNYHYVISTYYGLELVNQLIRRNRYGCVYQYFGNMSLLFFLLSQLPLNKDEQKAIQYYLCYIFSRKGSFK